MHVLVTGGAGFIGSHVVDFHLGRGDKVHVVDDVRTGSLANLSQHRENRRLSIDQEDILTWPELEKCLHWADRVYHLAAVVGVFQVLGNPIQVLATNIAGTERLLRAARTSRWDRTIVLASSAEVYGHGLPCFSCRYFPDVRPSSFATIDLPPELPFGEFREEQEPMVGSSAVSRWNYSISKLADEAFGLSYAREYGMDLIVARIFNTIGPRQTGRYGMVVPRFIEQAVEGDPITVYGSGEQTRSFCDVRDTVAALDLLASNAESSGEIVNVGNDREISINALAEMVRGTTGSTSPITHVPYEEAYGKPFAEAYRRRPNLEKFHRLTGYRHRWTLEDTIRDLVALERARRELSTEESHR